jgi:cysteine synthase A
MSDSSASPPVVYDNVLQLIGRTPLVRLNRLPKPDSATVLAKIEARNPGGSVKDRIGLAMIETAEREGKLRPGDTVVEPTSGNTGIGLAIVCAVRGYRLLLTMPEDMSIERRKLLSLLGAELILTPAIEGMSGAVYAAQELVDEHGYFMPQQFMNPANPTVHRETTALEILHDTAGELDAVVAMVGTGGTISGIGQAIQEKAPHVRVIAVEPAKSAVLSGGRPGITRIQGTGAGFVPGILDRSVLADVMTVEDEQAIAMAERLAKEEGILAGISAGGAVTAALAVAQDLGPAKTVVTVVPDAGERYLSMWEID